MKTREIIDVRPILKEGGCPFDTVIEKGQKLKPGEGISVIAPFNPLPLYEALKGIGVDFTEVNEENGTFTVDFTFTPLKERELASDLNLLDLEPPQPMMKAAEALAVTEIGSCIRIHTRFKPVHFLESLDAAEVSLESEEQSDGTWKTWLLKKGVKKCDH